jgi:RluA family pseudouridine synthase
MKAIPDVIYIDDALLVVNKPSGLLSLPDGYDHSKAHLRSVLEPHHGRLWIVHRLDKDTSGAVVLARNEAAHRQLNTHFAEHKVEKRYHAILAGNPSWDEVRVDVPLRVGVGRRNRTVSDELHGKPARTDFRVLERFDGYTWVEARPKTGRTHQIRAHLYSLGYSILADPLYGDGAASSLIDRLALHAQFLSVLHPITGKLVVFEAPIPQDIENMLSVLRAD